MTATVVEAAGLEATTELLEAAYGSLRIDGAHGAVRARFESQSCGPVTLNHLELGMAFTVTSDPLGIYIFGSYRSGAHEFRSGGTERQIKPGDAFLTRRPDDDMVTVVDHTVMDLVVVDPSAVTEVAAPQPGQGQEPIEFTGFAPATPAAAARWRRTHDLVHSLAHAPSEPLEAHELVASNAGRLLIATALATFPNTAVLDPTRTDRHDASTTTLQRAVSFIDDHADHDISVADIAEASFVTIRAVQLAFRRHLDTTPSAFLRRVRLDRAHRELLAGDPTVDTVTEVAYRWGFSSPSRFARYYRAAYGVGPRSTLES